MPPRKIRLLVNPSARSGRARRSCARARALAAALPLTLEWVESRSAAHLQDLTRGAQEDDLDALAVAGGDGTVGLALDALSLGARLPLGVLPVGSGNDFARDIGIRADPAEALAVLAGGEARQVDAGRVVGRELPPGGAHFCCVASLGLDELALRIIHSSWLPRSRVLNIGAALAAVVRYVPRPVRITWEGGAFEGEVMFAAVTLTRSYGGGFLLSPAARLDDGLLDLCIVRRTGRLRLLWDFRRILRGTHGGLPEVIQAASPWVRLEGLDGELPVALDGELPGLRTPVELTCEPAALRVLAPAATPLTPQPPLPPRGERGSKAAHEVGAFSATVHNRTPPLPSVGEGVGG